MNKLEFVKALDAGSEVVSDKTADLWFHILEWVQQRGYADTADTPEFVKHVQAFRRIGVATIGKHLGRMADAGFLSAHNLRRELPKTVKEEVATSVSAMVFGGGTSTLPTSFKRYTLPKVPCPLMLKSATALLERNRRFDEELRTHRSPTFS